MKKFFALVLCFSLFLGVASAYAASPLKLDYQHVSQARLVDGKASYNNAEFGWMFISLVSRDGKFETNAQATAVGTVSIGTATYTYHEDDEYEDKEKVHVEAAPKEFVLKAEDGAKADDDFKYYFRENTNGSEIEFLDDADTGLNGVAISWDISGHSELNGSTTIANLRGTENQLETAVPYFEFIKTDGKVSSIKWRLVKADDTTTPVSVDFASRIILHYRDNANNRETITAKGENSFDIGAIVSGETAITDAEMIEALSDPDNLRFFEVRVYDRTNNIYGYNWRFYPADNDIKTSLYATHVSDAKFIDGKSSYNDAAFKEVKLLIEDKNETAVFTKNLLNSKGEITISSATYTYDDGDTDNSVKVEDEIMHFPLIPEKSVVLGDEFDFRPASGDNEVHFTGNADTGLNGKTVTWWINDARPLLRGEETIPTFTSTANQLKDVVPYCEAIYDDDGKVSGFTYRLVKTSDTSKAVSVSYDSKITLRCKDTDGKLVKFTDGGDKFKEKISAGTAVSGTANLASAVELDDIRYIEARITNADNGVAHIWCFNTASSSSDKKSSSSGCDAGLLGVASLIILAGAAFKIKK